MKTIFLLSQTVMTIPLLGTEQTVEPVEKDYFAVEKYFETVTNDTMAPPENALAYEKSLFQYEPTDPTTITDFADFQKNIKPLRSSVEYFINHTTPSFRNSMNIDIYEVGPGNKLVKNENATSLDDTVKMLVAKEPVTRADIDKNLFDFLMLECEACKAGEKGQDKFVQNFFKKE